MHNYSFSDKLDLKIEEFLRKNPSCFEIFAFIESEAHRIVSEKNNKIVAEAPINETQ